MRTGAIPDSLKLRPLLRFLYVYVGRLGLLDGRPGFDDAVLLAFYEYLIGLKRREDTRRENRTNAEESADAPLETEAREA